MKSNRLRLLMALISMIIPAKTVSAKDLPPQEVLLCRNQVLSPILPDLGFARYDERRQCVTKGDDSFSAWIIPLGNRNQAPKIRNVNCSLNGASEGWLLFLDSTASEFSKALPILTEFVTPIEVYRRENESVFLIPFRNPEQDVWLKLASLVALKRKSISSDVHVIAAPVDSGELVKNLFPRLEQSSFFSFAERFRDALLKKTLSDNLTISPLLDLSLGNVVWSTRFPKEFRSSFPRLAFKIRNDASVSHEWEIQDLADTMAVFWILPVFDSQTGLSHDIYQPILETDSNNGVYNCGVTRIGGKTPPETITSLVYVGATQDYRVFLLPYNGINQPIWDHLVAVARDILSDFNEPEGDGRDVWSKLSNLRIPMAEWNSADIDDVISDLVAFSREFDEEEQDQTKRGVEIVLETSAGFVSDLPRITICEMNISMKEILDKIVVLTGLEYNIDNDRVIVSRHRSFRD